MNIRRGLFRFWVGLTLIWACLIGFVVFADAQKYFKFRQLTVDGSVLEISGMASRSTVKATLLEFFKKKTINGAVLTPSEAEETATEISQKFTNKDFPEFVLQTSVLLVSVPAILFALGALLLWIGSGFRRASGSPGT